MAPGPRRAAIFTALAACVAVLGVRALRVPVSRSGLLALSAEQLSDVLGFAAVDGGLYRLLVHEALPAFPPDTSQGSLPAAAPDTRAVSWHEVSVDDLSLPPARPHDHVSLREAYARAPQHALFSGRGRDWPAASLSAAQLDVLVPVGRAQATPAGRLWLTSLAVRRAPCPTLATADFAPGLFPPAQRLVLLRHVAGHQAGRVQSFAWCAAALEGVAPGDWGAFFGRGLWRLLLARECVAHMPGDVRAFAQQWLGAPSRLHAGALSLFGDAMHRLSFGDGRGADDCLRAHSSPSIPKYRARPQGRSGTEVDDAPPHGKASGQIITDAPAPPTTGQPRRRGKRGGRRRRRAARDGSASAGGEQSIGCKSGAHPSAGESGHPVPRASSADPAGRTEDPVAEQTCAIVHATCQDAGSSAVPPDEHAVRATLRPCAALARTSLVRVLLPGGLARTRGGGAPISASFSAAGGRLLRAHLDASNCTAVVVADADFSDAPQTYSLCLETAPRGTPHVRCAARRVSAPEYDWRAGPPDVRIARFALQTVGACADAASKRQAPRRTPWRDGSTDAPGAGHAPDTHAAELVESVVSDAHALTTDDAERGWLLGEAALVAAAHGLDAQLHALLVRAEPSLLAPYVTRSLLAQMHGRGADATLPQSTALLTTHGTWRAFLSAHAETHVCPGQRSYGRRLAAWRASVLRPTPAGARWAKTLEDAALAARLRGHFYVGTAVRGRRRRAARHSVLVDLQAAVFNAARLAHSFSFGRAHYLSDRTVSDGAASSGSSSADEQRAGRQLPVRAGGRRRSGLPRNRAPRPRESLRIVPVAQPSAPDRSLLGGNGRGHGRKRHRASKLKNAGDAQDSTKYSNSTGLLEMRVECDVEPQGGLTLVATGIVAMLATGALDRLPLAPRVLRHMCVAADAGPRAAARQDRTERARVAAALCLGGRRSCARDRLNRLWRVFAQFGLRAVVCPFGASDPHAHPDDFSGF